MSSFIDTDEFRNLLYSWPEKAIPYLYEHHYDGLIRIADVHTHDRSLSEDAVQDVFTDIAQRHKELGANQGQPFHAYLIKAVTNRSVTLYQKDLASNIRHTRYYYDNQRISGPEKNVETKIIAAERRSLLKLVIGTLPPRERECILMQTEQNLKVKEIARRLGITPKTVEWNLTEARKKLRKYGTNLE